MQGTTLGSDNGKTNWTGQTGKAMAVTVGAAAGLWLGPDGVVWGAMSGALLEPPAVRMIERMQQRMQRRTKRVADIAGETAGLSSEELYARICEDEKLQVLTFKAMEAATRTAWEDKLRTLGTSLASGVLASDETQFSTEQRIMAAIGDIEDAELALLDFLVAWRLGESGGKAAPVRLDIPEYSHSQRSDGKWSVGQRKWYVNVVQTYRPRLTSLLPSLIGTLQGHGLVTYESNVGNAGAILSEAPNPGPYVEPTQLGELVWLRFDRAGATVPHVWTSSAA